MPVIELVSELRVNESNHKIMSAKHSIQHYIDGVGFTLFTGHSLVNPCVSVIAISECKTWQQLQLSKLTH
jgi:hypothetical protein